MMPHAASDTVVRLVKGRIVCELLSLALFRSFSGIFLIIYFLLMVTIISDTKFRLNFIKGHSPFKPQMLVLPETIKRFIICLLYVYIFRYRSA